MKLTSERRGGESSPPRCLSGFNRHAADLRESFRIMTRPPHIVFAGGGSAGQLYPGLAIGAHVVERMPEAAITFVGSGKAMERHAVRAAGFAYVNLPSQPAPQGPLRAVRFVTDNVAGYWASRWFLKERKVSLVVGLGGYASAATVRAASARGIPTVLLEQNAVPDRATRWLANTATAVCAGFDQTRTYFGSHVPLTVTGNPARPAFERYSRRLQAEPAIRIYRGETAETTSHSEAIGATDTTPPSGCDKRMIVIGGAGGARTLNQFMPRALQRLGDALAGWQIIHQTGEGQLQETERLYRTAGLDALVVSYIDEMAPVMFESDLVVCRAGGTTLAELALAGVPAVIVPHPFAADGYQMANAKIFAGRGAATIIDETTLSGTFDEALVDRLRPLILDEATRGEMAAKMRLLAQPNAASQITDTIHSIVCRSARRIAA